MYIVKLYTYHIYVQICMLRSEMKTDHDKLQLIFVDVSFPTCQVRVVRFYQSCSPPPPPPHPPPPPPPPPRSPDPSGHSRTSTASARSQWALPDLHRELQIPVGTAGPQLRGCSGHSRSQWALPDLNRDFQIAVGTAGPQPRAPDASGHCRTSTASFQICQWALPDLNRELQIPVGTAGPQRPDRMPEDMPDRMPEDMPDRMPDRYAR